MRRMQQQPVPQLGRCCAAGARADTPHCRTPTSAAHQGKTILELGSGTGFGGLSFAALGASVLLTDLPKCMVMLAPSSPSAFPHMHVLICSAQGLLQQNIAENAGLVAQAQGSVACCPFVWGVTPLTELPRPWQRPDLVVAADVLYSPPLVAPLLKAVIELGERMAWRGCSILLTTLLVVLTIC